MKTDRLNWLIAPIPFYALVSSFFFEDGPLRRTGNIALVLTIIWILTRDYTNVSRRTMVRWLAALYGVMALIFIFLLPATPEYVWWRLSGAIPSFAFALYIGVKNKAI